MKPVLLAMNNPHRTEAKYALFPSPAGSAGGRLCGMLRAVRPDLFRADYLRAFDRRNLVQGPWSARKAALQATHWREMWEGVSSRRGFTPGLLEVLVLGEGPRVALGLPKQLLHPIERGGVVYRQLPHPSGRCLWYNHPTHRLLAGLLLEELYEQAS